MATYKIYRSGNNIEIYEYENLSTGYDVAGRYDSIHEKRERLKELEIKLGRHTALILKAEQMEKKGVNYTKVKNKLRVDFGDEANEYLQLKEYFKLMDEKVKTAADDETKKKRRIQTLRDNANNLKRMVREYFTNTSFMLTLTYSDKYKCEPDQLDKSDRRVKAMWNKLKKAGYEFKYCGVRELQKKRNAIHYHFIFDCKQFYNEYVQSNAEIDSKRKKNDWHKEFENDFEKKYWKYGFVDIRHIEGIDDTGAYLAKYMTKAHIKDMEWLENRRLVLRSEGIKKIEPIADSSKMGSIIEQIELIKSIAQSDILNNLERKRVFMNGYESDFCGQVTYMEIHLNRLEEILGNILLTENL